MTLNDAQTWTVIGVLAAGFGGFLSVIMTLLNRTISTELRSIRGEIGGLRSEVSSEIGGLRREFDLRFTSLESRVDRMAGELQTLDREVATIGRKVFGEE